MRRVVVTGMGTVNPIGLNVDEYWEGLKAGKTGFGEITYFDTTDFKVKVAAEVKGFVAADRMDKKAARRMEPFAQYAVAAAKEAFEDAGLDMEKEDPYRVGCAIGSGVGSLQSIEREHKKLLEKGPSSVRSSFLRWGEKLCRKPVAGMTTKNLLMQCVPKRMHRIIVISRNRTLFRS